MSQSQVIIAMSDAWLLDSALPAVRRHNGIVYAPADDALPTQEVAIIPREQPDRAPATTLLPVLRLPQRQSSRDSTPVRWQLTSEANDLPTVVMPVLCQAEDDITTVMLPVATLRAFHSATPTRKRSEPCHYCYQCGAVVPPWREICFAHEANYGRGLPPPTTLQALPDSAVDLRPTLPLPAIARRQRAG